MTDIMEKTATEESKAKIFWEKFSDEICDKNEKGKNIKLKEQWYNWKGFTKLILDKLETILKEIDSDAKTEREYFRVDLISYCDKGSEGRIYRGLKKYSWNLLTAVEHENDSQAWMDEVIKLAHLSCELRVVIGYLPISQHDRHNVYLEKISSELNQISAWNFTKGRGEFLIIIGDSSVGKDMDKCCVYTPYLYNKKNDTFELYNTTDGSTENNLEHRKQ